MQQTTERKERTEAFLNSVAFKNVVFQMKRAGLESGAGL